MAAHVLPTVGATPEGVDEGPVRGRQLERGKAPMTKAIFRKHRIAVLLTTLAAVGAIAALTTATASAQGGRTIDGTFCLGEHYFCMGASFDGQTTEGFCTISLSDPNPQTDCNTNLVSAGGTASPGRLVLRPGTYWVTVPDDNSKHNFELRSCPESTSPCSDGNPAALPEQQITTVDGIYPDPVTIKVNLKHGWYRLFCDAQQPVVHEAAGMYVDIEVGGVGQGRCTTNPRHRSGTRGARGPTPPLARARRRPARPGDHHRRLRQDRPARGHGAHRGEGRKSR